MESDTETEPWKAEDVSKFMNSPLVQWIKTFKKSNEGLEYDELSDSVFLLDVLLTIDGDDGFDAELMSAINRSASLNRIDRLRNWMLLVRSLHRCYFECLQQLVVAAWPDIFIITDEANKGGCMAELQKFLVLILGYAVQCEHKESYVQEIKGLTIDAQQSLVFYIQQITDSPKSVVPIGEGCVQADTDTYRQILSDLCLDRLRKMENLITLSDVGAANSTTDLQDNVKTRLTNRSLSLNPQLNSEDEKRKQLRSLSEELDETTRLLTETRNQLAEVHTELSKTKIENTILSAEVNAAKIYKDEIEAVKELTLQTEKQRKQIDRYKNAVTDINFYRSRLEELRKENDMLLESKGSVEEQLTNSAKQVEKVKNELDLARLQLQNNESEKSELNRKLVELMEEKTKLEYENSQTRNGFLNRFTSITSLDCLQSTTDTAAAPVSSELCKLNGCNSISGEMSENLKVQLTRVMSENEELTTKLKESADKRQKLEESIEQMRRKNEAQFQEKAEKLKTVQRQFVEQQQRNTKLSKDFEQKMSKIEAQNQLQKQNLSKDFEDKQNDLQQKNRSLEQHIEELQKQISFIENNWKRDKATCAKLHGTVDDEKRQLKARGKSENHDKANDSPHQAKSEQVEKGTNSLQKQAKPSDLCERSFDTQSTVSSKLISLDPTDVDNNSADSSLTSVFKSNASCLNDIINKDQTASRDRTTEEPYSREHQPSQESKRSKTPVRGVVVPLMRSNEHPSNSAKQEERSNSLQHSISYYSPAKPTLDQLRHRLVSSGTILRNDHKRHSMPVRISSSSQHHQHGSSRGSKQWAVGDGFPRRQPTGVRDTPSSSGREYASSTQSPANSVSTDNSYCSRLDNSTVSEATGLSRDRHHRSHHDHKGSSQRGPHWQYSSYEEKMVTETITENLLGDDKHRCRALVDQLMQLQSHSQKLRADNAELQQQVQAHQKFKEKANGLDERILQLETENKKLKAIIEALHGSVPQSLYDKRTYQFNTIV